MSWLSFEQFEDEALLPGMIGFQVAAEPAPEERCRIIDVGLRLLPRGVAVDNQSRLPFVAGEGKSIMHPYRTFSWSMMHQPIPSRYSAFQHARSLSMVILLGGPRTSRRWPCRIAYRHPEYLSLKIVEDY